MKAFLLLHLHTYSHHAEINPYSLSVPLILSFPSLLPEPCCALKYYPEIEICVKEQKGEQEAKKKEAQRIEDENFGTHIVGRVREGRKEGSTAWTLTPSYVYYINKLSYGSLENIDS